MRSGRGWFVAQAGGVVVRRGRRGPEVLLVSSRRRSRWTLPKGTIEPGESVADAAVREVREEAGVRGRVLAPAGVLRRVSWRGLVRVEYVLVVYAGRARRGAERGRVVRWCGVDEAIAAVSSRGLRRVLRRAGAAIARAVA